MDLYKIRFTNDAEEIVRAEDFDNALSLAKNYQMGVGVGSCAVIRPVRPDEPKGRGVKLDEDGTPRTVETERVDR
jgi:hypothetical protein